MNGYVVFLCQRGGDTGHFSGMRKNNFASILFISQGVFHLCHFSCRQLRSHLENYQKCRDDYKI